MNGCENCLEYYDQGVKQGRQDLDRYDTLLTETEVRELLKEGGKLEGYWAVTILVPFGSNPFTIDKAWLDLLNQLTEEAGVKITSLKFKLKANVALYVFGLRED
jgi:hypothetical protein